MSRLVLMIPSPELPGHVRLLCSTPLDAEVALIPTIRSPFLSSTSACSCTLPPLLREVVDSWLHVWRS